MKAETSGFSSGFYSAYPSSSTMIMFKSIHKLEVRNKSASWIYIRIIYSCMYIYIYIFTQAKNPHPHKIENIWEIFLYSEDPPSQQIS